MNGVVVAVQKCLCGNMRYAKDDGWSIWMRSLPLEVNYQRFEPFLCDECTPKHAQEIPKSFIND